MRKESDPGDETICFTEHGDSDTRTRPVAPAQDYEFARRTIDSGGTSS